MVISDAEFEERLERHRQAALKEKDGKPVTKSDEYYGGRLGEKTPDQMKAIFADCAERGLWADSGRFIGATWLSLRKMGTKAPRHEGTK